MIITVPIMTKIFKVRDTTLAVIGVISGFAGNICKGSILKPSGYYLSFIVGCLAGLGPIAMRAYVSKIVDRNEITKIFSLLATLESIMPLISTVIFTEIFTATIKSYPSLIHHVCAAALFVPLISLTWMEFNCKII